MKHMKLKIKDTVIVLTGRDKGREEKIEKLIPKKGKAIVTGINMYKKHVKKTQDNDGKIIDITKPIDISKVALKCPECGKATRVGYIKIKNKKQRVCRKCKKVIK